MPVNQEPSDPWVQEDISLWSNRAKALPAYQERYAPPSTGDRAEAEAWQDLTRRLTPSTGMPQRLGPRQLTVQPDIVAAAYGSLSRRDGAYAGTLKAAWERNGKVDGIDFEVDGINENDAKSLATDLACYGGPVSALAAVSKLREHVRIHRHTPEELVRDAKLLRQAAGQDTSISLPVMREVVGANGAVTYEADDEAQQDTPEVSLGRAADAQVPGFRNLTARQQRQLVPGSFAAALLRVAPPTKPEKGLVWMVANRSNGLPAAHAAADTLLQPEWVMVVREPDCITGYPVGSASVVSKDTAGAVKVTALKPGKEKTAEIWIVKDPVPRLKLRPDALKAVITSLLSDHDDAMDLQSAMANLAAAAHHHRKSEEEKVRRLRDSGDKPELSHASWASL